MSYLIPAQVSAARAPAVTDDAAAGFVLGSTFTDTSVIPPAMYVCLDDSVGAALWRRYGGVSQHSGLSNLSWNLAAHDGTANSVAAFNASNVAAVFQPVTDGSVFTANAGTFQWTAPPPPILVVSSRTGDIQTQAGAATLGVTDALTDGNFTISIVSSSAVLGTQDSLVTGAVV